MRGSPQFDLTVKTPIEKIDLILQRERVSDPPASTKVLFTADIDALPDGVFVVGPRSVASLKSSTSHFTC